MLPPASDGSPGLINTQSTTGDRIGDFNPHNSINAGLSELIERYRPTLVGYEVLYRKIHQNPELSGKESDTANLVASELSRLGFETHTGIGGHGVVGVLENGTGPCVLLRSELDALPVKEQTGLSYASRKTMEDEHGESQPTMHACGHDMHIACLLAASDLLKAASKEWSGTLVSLFQPAEEGDGGARQMVEGGLYRIVPKPDILIAQHTGPLKAGVVAIRSGPVLASSDSFDIRVFGKGGHGGKPHLCIDPVLAACRIITDLQSITSREVRPGEVAVLTCGSIHGGSAANIIPDHVDFKVDIRTYSHDIRDQVVRAMKRIIKAGAQIAGMPQEPSIKLMSRTPLTENEPGSFARIIGEFGKYFGDSLWEDSRGTASEDFPDLAHPIGQPYLYWHIGSTEERLWDEAGGQQGSLAPPTIPGNHSSRFSPAIEPTLKTGTSALALAALTYLYSGKR